MSFGGRNRSVQPHHLTDPCFDVAARKFSIRVQLSNVNTDNAEQNGRVAKLNWRAVVTGTGHCITLWPTDPAAELSS